MKQIWNNSLKNQNFAGFRGRFLFQSQPNENVFPINDFARSNTEVDDSVHFAYGQFRNEIKRTAGIDSARIDRNRTTPGSLESFFVSEHNGRLLNPLRQLRMIFMPKRIFGQRLAAGRNAENVATGAGTIGRYSDIENQLDQISGDDTFRFIRSGGRVNRMAGASLYALGGIKNQIKSLDQALRKDIKIGEKQNKKVLSSGTFLSKFARKAASWAKAPLHETINRFNLSRLENTAKNLLADAEKSETILTNEINRLYTNTEAYQSGLSARNENDNKITFRKFINDVVAHPNDFLTGNGAVFNGYNFEIVTGSQNRRHVLDLILIKYAKEVAEAEQSRAAHEDMTTHMERSRLREPAVENQIAGITSIKTGILDHLPVYMKVEGTPEEDLSEAGLVEDIIDNIIRINTSNPAYLPPNPAFNIDNVIFAGAENGLTNPAKLAYLLNYMQNTLDPAFLIEFDQNTANKIHKYMENIQAPTPDNGLNATELTELKTNSNNLITTARDALTDCANLHTFFTVAEQPNLVAIGLVNIEKFIKDFDNLKIQELIEKIKPEENRGIFKSFWNKMNSYKTKLEKVVTDAKAALAAEDARAAATPPRIDINFHIPSELKLVPGDSIDTNLTNLATDITAFTFPPNANRGQNLNTKVRTLLSYSNRKQQALNFKSYLAKNAEYQWNYWRTAQPGRMISTIQVSRENHTSHISIGSLAAFNNLHIVENRSYDLVVQDETGDNLFIMEPDGTNENGIQKLKLYRFEVGTGDINALKETTSKENADATYTILSLSAA